MRRRSPRAPPPTSGEASRGCSRPRARRRRAARARRAPGELAEAVRRSPRCRQRVLDVRVEARRDEERSGAKPRHGPLDLVVKAARYSSSPDPAGSGMLSVVSSCSSGPPVPGIERPLVQRDEEDRVGRPGRSPACRCRGGRPSRRSRRARARARPARSARRPRRCRRGRSPSRGPASAWWPGGRTSAKPPRSTASIAAPAASSAASVASSPCRACPRSSHARPAIARGARSR